MQKITEKNGQQDSRLVRLETLTENLVVKVDKIMDNHLPHLDKKVDRILWFILTSSIAIIGLLLKQMF